MLNLKRDGVYKARNHVYDISDRDIYTIRIVSDKKVDYPMTDIYYEAVIVGVNHKVHFYPADWSSVEELSSLELELL